MSGGEEDDYTTKEEAAIEAENEAGAEEEDGEPTSKRRRRLTTKDGPAAAAKHTALALLARPKAKPKVKGKGKGKADPKIKAASPAADRLCEMLTQNHDANAINTKYLQDEIIDGVVRALRRETYLHDWDNAPLLDLIGDRPDE